MNQTARNMLAVLLGLGMMFPVPGYARAGVNAFWSGVLTPNPQSLFAPVALLPTPGALDVATLGDGRTSLVCRGPIWENERYS